MNTLTKKKSEKKFLNAKEELDHYKRMSSYYKKRFTDSVEIRKSIVSENIDLVNSYEKLEKQCAECEHELKKLKNKKWWNIFK
jgi:hypothetical protein